jgi:hypothetical protein
MRKSSQGLKKKATSNIYSYYKKLSLILCIIDSIRQIKLISVLISLAKFMHPGPLLNCVQGLSSVHFAHTNTNLSKIR